MPRVIPVCPPLAQAKSGGQEQSYRIELITPLFGGGVDAGENDPTMPIRGTSIRGQLQFWWRATRGRRHATPQEMWRRQEEIFGSSAFSSPLEVAVSDVRGLASLDSVTDFYRFGPEAYALFPAIDKRSKLIKAGLTFLISLRWPTTGQLAERRAGQNKALVRARQRPLPDRIDDIGPDIDAAMWAWTNFGGLGARTRRGLGALRCKEFAPADVTGVREWFARGVDAHVSDAENGPHRWSVLPRTILSRLEAGAAQEVWSFLLGEYKHFRQGVGLARNKGRQANRPGQSHYPEPDTIRRIMNTWSTQHEPQSWMPIGFPRAEFGLPIVFHFKDENQGDPPQTCLYPYVAEEKKDRMASPLVLKPLALQNGSAVPVIVQLLGPQVSQVELWADAANGDCLTPNHSVPVRSSAFSDQTYPNSPLAGLTDKGSALEAFLNFARRPSTEDGPGFVEITR